MVDSNDRDEVGRGEGLPDDLFRKVVAEGREYAVFITDLDGRVVTWNAGARRILGYEPDEIIGASASLFFTPEDLARGADREEIRKALETGRAEDTRWHVRKGGARFWSNGVAEPLREEGGLVRFLVKRLRDDSERKALTDERERLLARLRADQRVLESTLQQMPAGVTIAEAPSGRLLFQNDRALELVGHPLIEAADVSGYARYGALHADLTPYEAREYPMARALAGEVVHGEEMLYRRGDGAVTSLSVDAAPVRDERGEIVVAVSTFHDVSDRRRREEERAELLASERAAREAAEAAERRSAFLAEASAVLGSSLDYETTLASISQLAVPAFADWCGVDVLGPDGALRRLAIAHADPEKLDRAREYGARFPPDPDGPYGSAWVVRAGRPQLIPDFTEEMAREAARGEEHLHAIRDLGVASIVSVPMRARGAMLGAITFVSAEAGDRYDERDLAFAQELAARASLAIDNARLYREAQEANRAKDLFLAVVSHELRTPLNAILGWTQILRGGPADDAATARALETIHRNARAQATLIEDLLDYSRILSGTLRLTLGRVALGGVVETAADVVRPAADAKRVALSSELACAPAHVMADADRLQQVFVNLLNNAVKFTDEGGRVDVRLTCEGGSAVVAVRDTGQGIDTAFLPYLFDQFRQADATTTRRHGGLGLGLAIVRQLVEIHGGAVRAESGGPGHGSTFVVTLPLAGAGEAAGRAAEDDQPADRRRLDGVRVLVVDDERDARDLLEVLLGARGALVRTAGSAAEAFEEIGRSRYDVLVTDIAMPDEDGYSLLRRVRALGPGHGGRTPAVALTAYAGAEERRRALMAGFQTHLAKPAEPEELIAAVANLATGRREAG